MARARHAQIEQMSFGLLITDPEAHRIQAMRKPRKCLSCSDQFLSTGPGNRICGSCKGRDIWATPNDFSIAAAF